MRSTSARFATTLVVALLVAACSATPSLPPVQTPSPPPVSSASATPTGTPRPTGAPTAAPALPPSPASANLPVHGSARGVGIQVRLAAGPDGTLWVSIPRPGGSVLALLDGSGRPRPGWPVQVPDSTGCDLLLPVDDGSVRVVCTPEDPDGSRSDLWGAVAFGPNGNLLAGWPVAVEGFSVTGRMVGDDLALFTRLLLDDAGLAGLLTVGADGVLGSGTRVPDLGAGSVDPDGVAYGVTGDDTSSIWAVDRSGMRAGWPVAFDGFASQPAFGPGGRLAVIAGSPTAGTSQVLVFDGSGNAVQGRSAPIPIVTVDESWGDTGGCPPWPQPPLVASDGTIFVYSEATPAIVAVDPSLKVMRGWPYRPAAPLVLRDERYVKEDAYCPSLAIPAVGPDSTLYLPLQAATPSAGGTLVAVGPNGKVRPGWPVELKRAGSEFWSVVVGADGTVYALAIEPESSTSSSATILAIAPDSTVRWTTTIVEP